METQCKQNSVPIKKDEHTKTYNSTNKVKIPSIYYSKQYWDKYLSWTKQNL